MRLFSKTGSILIIMLTALLSCTNDSANLTVSNQGTGGSLTRFTIQGNYLYVASLQSISVFSLQSDNLNFISKIDIDFGIETIISKGTYLYLGAREAMYIYSIANPEKPSFVFRYAHIVSCDPVVVEKEYAYVTLSSGNVCNRGVNALEIINISDPYNPILIANYPMNRPLGLGISNSILFVCEQEFGLKMFDVSNPQSIKLLDEDKSIQARDVIVHNGMATVTGSEGVYQYSFLPSLALEQVSAISIMHDQ
jgi:hypothetical protein